MDEIGLCARCGDYVYTDEYIHDGEIICQECYEYGERIDSVLEFIKAYPKVFFEYLEECLISDEEPVKALLADYKEWAEADFYKWVFS